MDNGQYIKKRKKLSGILFETALPNEYLVRIGQKEVKPILGGRKFKIFRKFIRIPASVQTLHFQTDNANRDYQGIGIEGYASWRINPESPGHSITVLDFFDEDNPMARTNDKLRTICVEAVRHVISNMTIDDALKKKELIAQSLKEQLREIETKWGIVFDKVGIDKVNIMSKTLFEELQAQFRDNLRLDVARVKITTDREIAKEQNSMREKTELEKQDTDKKINLSRIDNDSRIKEVELKERQLLTLKEREIREEEYRKEMAFKMEQEEKQHELALLDKNLEIKLQDTLRNFYQTENDLAFLRTEIGKKDLELEKQKRLTEQIFTEEALANKLIGNLAEIFAAVRIDNYTVLDSGHDGTISPFGKLLAEAAAILKSTDLKHIFEKKKKKE